LIGNQFRRPRPARRRPRPGQQQRPPPPRGQDGGQGGGIPGPLGQFDTNHDGVIDASELRNAPAEVKTLDVNGRRQSHAR